MILRYYVCLLYTSRVLTNHSRLHFFTGTSEILCRAVLLDKEEIGPGESGYVQLRLEEEIAVRRGDKFVVRFYSPMAVSYTHLDVYKRQGLFYRAMPMKKG